MVYVITVNKLLLTFSCGKVMVALAERSKRRPRACSLILGFVAKRILSVMGGHSHGTSVRRCSLHLTASRRSKQKLRAVSWGGLL